MKFITVVCSLIACKTTNKYIGEYFTDISQIMWTNLANTDNRNLSKQTKEIYETQERVHIFVTAKF